MGVMNQKQRRKNRVFLLLIGFFLLFLLSSLSSSASKTMFIEVYPPQPVSNENFTVSVYDPYIINGTPYLSNVNITFENNSYTITDEHPNRELELTAPMVLTPTTFTIDAYKDTYNNTNKTITVVPTSSDSDYIMITVITESLNAYQPFTLRVTDRYNNPIENATVSIQHTQSKQSDGTTNNSGYITLIAPNQKEIYILAQKNGFQEATITVFIQTQKNPTIAVLSHPFFPVFIACCILITSIVFVTLKNRRNKREKPVKNKPASKQENKYHLEKKMMEKSKTKQNQSSIITKQKDPIHSSKIEEITITKPHPKQKTIDINPNNHDPKKDFSETFQWHSPKGSVESQVDSLLSKEVSSKKQNDWFEGQTAVRDAVDQTIRQKRKKKKSS
jgi:hypothetical protein